VKLLFKLLAAASTLFLFDRFLKSWSHYIGVHDNFLISWGYLKNTGGAFSTPVPILFLVIFGLIALIFLGTLVDYAWCNNYKYKLWGAGLMFIGGVSNLIDRVFAGGVVDMFHLTTGLSFNLADVYLIAGAVLLLL
jgi:lipoprotein signal peptidase